MNIISLLLACVAVVLFLVAASGRAVGNLVALALAFLATAWIVQLVFPAIQQIVAH